MITVVSANFGRFDQINRQAGQDVDCDWVLFTDDNSPTTAPWRAVVLPEATDPRMAAKRFKCKPPFGGDVVWIDASMEVINKRFVREALESRRDGVAVWRHPRRDCIYEEAAASVGDEDQHGKYAGMPLTLQAESYRGEYPVHGGLFACGTVAYDMTDPRVLALGAAWFDECVKWTPQDQVSFPVVCRRLGVEPGVFPVAQGVQNRWMWIHDHR